MSQYGAALFDSTSGVMYAERVLQMAGIKVKLVPTPRQFSSDCGIAVRFDAVEMERVRALLEHARVRLSGLHEM